MRLPLGPIIACVMILLAWLPSLAMAGGGTPLIDAPLTWSKSKVEASSGIQRGVLEEERLAWYSMVQAPQASWLRLEFGADTKLGLASDNSQTDSFIRITSLEDGAEQVLTAESLAQWNNTSAYFNGTAVIVELITGQNNSLNKLSISSTQVGDVSPIIYSQCGLTDDRVASNDPRVCRITSVGCTGWMINDANHMFLTAGHCPAKPGFSVAQFNVPLSNIYGNIIHPPAEDQYSIDATSIQYTNGGIGDDWCYFGVFPNSNTGQTPFQTQQAAFAIATPPTVASQEIRITGFGVDTDTANQTNQTHTGSFTSNSGTTLKYAVDTTGGNSGSPVIVEGTGVAVGIHTHGGCSASGGYNSGTSYNQTALQTAIANPKGTCQSIEFTYPNGVPTQFSTEGGDQIAVTFTSPLDASAAALPKMIWKYENASITSTISGVLVSDNTYTFTTPAFTCGTRILFGFSARMGATGGLCTWPKAFPQQYLAADASTTSLVLWSDNFQNNQSWTASSDGATAGLWSRGTPNGGGFTGDPLVDFDGSGQCFVTGNVEGDNVSDGIVTLTSPSMDATTAINPYLAYSIWFTNNAGANPDQDVMTVELSNDAGQTWVLVETVGPTGTVEGWMSRIIAVGDFVSPSNALQLRFTASDSSGASVVEAGVDGVRLLADNALGWCGPQGDFNNDLVTDSSDLGLMLLHFGEAGITDLDGDGNTDSSDLGLLLLLL
ncbi:MAG: hypothetical protein EXS12_07915 [Phycisphaerales bacterium]|nr:hypothetical protein [Phycisphaerales bacterium]